MQAAGTVKQKKKGSDAHIKTSCKTENGWNIHVPEKEQRCKQAACRGSDNVYTIKKPDFPRTIFPGVYKTAVYQREGRAHGTAGKHQKYDTGDSELDIYKRRVLKGEWENRINQKVKLHQKWIAPYSKTANGNFKDTVKTQWRFPLSSGHQCPHA